jgi:hypothetical protein
MINLRFSLLTAENPNKNGVKVELNGILKINLTFLGLDKVIFFSLIKVNSSLTDNLIRLFQSHSC